MHRRDGRVTDAVFQAQRFGQFHLGHPFEHAQYQGRVDVPLGNQIVAMVAVLQDQVIGRDCLPEGQIVQRLKPLFYVLNIFENDHAVILPKRGAASQIRGVAGLIS